METHLDNNQITLQARADGITPWIFKFIPLIDATRFNEHFQKLEKKQQEFIFLLDECLKEKKNCVISVSGCAGAGKTFTVVETCKLLKLSVMRMAPTNSLASQIGGTTIHSGLGLSWGGDSELAEVTKNIQSLDAMNDDYIFKSLTLSQSICEKELYCPLKPDMVIIDEVGMIPFWLTYQIIQYFFKHFNPVIIVLMGDKYQLRPVECHMNIFNAILPNISLREIDLSTVNKRFDSSYNDIINQLMNFIRLGERTMEFNQAFDFIRKTFKVIDYMTEPLLKETKSVLAYKNATVNRYNEQYLNLDGKKVKLVMIVDDKVFPDKYVVLKQDCDIFITQRTMYPKGTRLKFRFYDSNSDKLVCEYLNSVVTISRCPCSGMFPVQLGFACTIHKYQGSTIDHSVIIDFDYCSDVYLMYTALSRVRSLSQVIGVLHI